MKLKKWLCTLVAVGLTSAAFAGNTSELRILIVQFFAPMVQAEELITEPTEQQKEVFQLLKALKQGLLNYDTNLSKGVLQETDKAIDKAFKTTIPGILNKIKESSDEVTEELTPVINQLTNQILLNQQNFKQNSYSAEVLAAGQETIRSFAIAKAITEVGCLEEVPAGVLTWEIMGNAIDQMLESAPEEQ